MSSNQRKPDPVSKALALYDLLNDMSTTLWEAFEEDFLDRFLPEILETTPPENDLSFGSVVDEGEDIPF